MAQLDAALEVGDGVGVAVGDGVGVDVGAGDAVGVALDAVGETVGLALAALDGNGLAVAIGVVVGTVLGVDEVFGATGAIDAPVPPLQAAKPESDAARTAQRPKRRATPFAVAAFDKFIGIARPSTVEPPSD